MTALTDVPARHRREWLETPNPGLVSPVVRERQLPSHPGDPGEPGAGDPAGISGWWLLGAHGGAGVTSLVRAGVGGRDAAGAWPAHRATVVVVVRRTAYGLEWARDAARQHASGGVPDGVVLAGLVVVADAPGRTPRRLARFLDLVAAAFPRVWEIPWVEEWRLAGHSEPLPLPPPARQLDRDMGALVGARSSD